MADPPHRPTLAALQPPGSTGLVLFRFRGLSDAPVARRHDRPGLGPYDGPSLGVIAIDTHGALLLTDCPVPALRPTALLAAADRLRRPGDDEDAVGADVEAMPTWPVRRSAHHGMGAPTRSVVDRTALDADELERLARAMIDVANRVVAPSWPVRFVPSMRDPDAGAPATGATLAAAPAR